MLTSLPLAALLLVAGCGERGEVTTYVERPTDGVSRAPVIEWDGHDPAPPVTVVAANGAFLEARSWGYCYDDACVDASPPPVAELADAGRIPELLVSFPEPGWTFEATLHSDLQSGTPGQGCDRSVAAAVESTGERTATVRPTGPAGRWRVDLFGRGPDGGDVIASVLWTTPRAKPVPAASARFALLTEHDGRLDTYGLELSLRDLDRTPERVTTTVTVTDAAGASRTLPAVDESPSPCGWGEGAVVLDRPDRFAAPVLELGPGPWTYDVALEIDGVTYRGRAMYPDDLVAGEEPGVALTFDPPLASWRP